MDTVKVTAIGNVSGSEFCSILANFDIQIRNDNTAALDIVLADDYLHPDILEIHKKNLATQHPWMLIKPNGYQIWIGPVFNTHEKSGCYLCLKKKLELNQVEKTLITLKKNLRRPPSLSLAKLPVTFNLASTLAAIEIKRYLQKTADHKLNGSILTLNTLKWKTRYHDLLIDEDCPNCKKFLNFHQEDEHQPQNLKTLYRYVSPITGIISKIRVHKLPGSYVSDTINCISLSDHHYDVLSLKENDPYMVNGGKGFTKKKAKLTAISETLERYSGFFKGNEARIASSLRSLGSQAIHPNECMLYSQTQYQQRDIINNEGNPFNQVPLPFNEDQETDWSPVYSLTQNKEYYLPTQFLYYKYHSHPLKRPNSPIYCQHDSNGNAAHFNYISAVLKGLFELVERDAVAIWWYNRLNKPQVEIENFEDNAIHSISNKHKSLNRELWILDLTTDLEIPVFTAISCQKNDKSNIVFGFGCHLDPKLAIKSAILEMNQMFHLVKLLNKNKDENVHKKVREWLQFANLQNQNYLKPSGQYKDKFDTLITNKIEMLKFCLGHLENKGFNILLLDQTKPYINLRVVKVIIPGLRHFWPRFAPGRLYDVPVKMGWLPKAFNESELNPIDFFL